jgi:DNA-directed RNA polymerase specialized sigma24 family protein
MVEEEKWIEEVTNIATTVAYTITRNYKGFAEVDDVKQELLEWSLKRQDKIQEWLSPQLDRKEYKIGIKRLARTFNRMADRYCRKEKAKKLGYSVYDEVFYSPALVEQLLPLAFNSEIETKDPNSEFVSGGGGDPATAGSFLASMYDVRTALGKLSIESYSMVRMRYEDGVTLADMVPLFNQSDSTISRKINTAIKQISKELGGESPWV